MITVRHSVATLFVVLFALSTLLAQDSKRDSLPIATTTALTITVAATSERVRFTAPGSVVRIHVEVYSEAGETLFDGSSKGNVFDWTIADSAGQRVADGSYVCVVTAKTLSGKISQRLGTVAVYEGQVSVRGAQSAQLLPAQQQAVGPVEENAALTVLAAGDVPSATVLAHDGRDGQVTSTTGALTFRTGDFFSGTDKEQMRLTEDGSLGVGTAKPKAKLDVAGLIRAREGFQFLDGSKLNVNEKGALTLTNSTGEEVPNVAGTGTENRLVKWTDSSGTLGDSTITEVAGRVGIGVTSPTYKLVVGPDIGSGLTTSDLTVSRGPGSSVSAYVGASSSNGMNFGWDQANLRAFVNAPVQSPITFTHGGVSERMRISTDGNIGIGTTTPASKLVVAAGGSGGTVNFGTPNGETGMGIIGTNRADVRFDGTALKLVAGLGSGAAPSTNGLAINTTGLVGVGTLNPTLGRLHVVSSDSTLPGIYGESANRGVWGKSTSGSRGVFGESLSGEGVHGESTSGTGVAGFTQSNSFSFPGVYGSSSASGGYGVRGDGTTGVFGNSTSSNGIGVTGEANAANGRGVYGTSTSATGIGVYGTSTSAAGYGVFANNPNGLALGVAGNASQNLDKGGLVKAMLYVGKQGTIFRCYNSQRQDGGAGLPPSGTTGCGFSVNNYANGRYEIDFGFRVNDRFVAITAQDLSEDGGDNFNFGANFRYTGTNTVNVYTFETDVLDSQSGQEFMIIVF